MKAKIIKYMSRHFYPQNIFAESILNHISGGVHNKTLIDAPCGNGETSWRFSRHETLSVYGYDIDEASINRAKDNYQRSNLNFDVADILKVIEICKTIDYFCLINSLFLLPEPSRILSSIRQKMNSSSILFIIVPNTEGKNFKWFNFRNPGFNNFVLKKDDFASYFLGHKLNVIKVIPLAYAHSYGRRDVKLFSVFAHFYLRLINFFQTSFSIGKPNYYLISLEIHSD